MGPIVPSPRPAQASAGHLSCSSDTMARVHSNEPDRYIRVYASRVHNLKTVDVAAPRDA